MLQSDVARQKDIFFQGVLSCEAFHVQNQTTTLRGS